MKAVITDIGGVVMPFSSPDDVIEAWEDRLGISRGELAVLMWEQEQMNLATLGHITAEEYWSNASRRLGVSLTTMEQLVAEYFQGARPDLRLLEFLQSLRPGVAVAAISNGWSDFPRIKAKEIGTSFDFILVSALEGVAKPDPVIFQRALDRLDVKPTNAIFIDDTEGHVQAAKDLGMVAHLHRTTETTIAEIEEFLRP